MSSPKEPGKILVVEDEWLIALDIAMLVEEFGHVVIGPVRNVQDALALIEADGIDAAILDISLGPEKSYPVARTLDEKGVPVVFLTAYSRSDIPGEYGKFDLLQKPLAPTALKSQLRRMLDKT